MDIAVIGTGFIGRTLGGALAEQGHNVTFGSRHPDNDNIGDDSPARVTSVGRALETAEVVIVAIPGPAVESVASEHDRVLATKLVIPVRRVGETLALTRGLRPWTTPLGFGWK